MEYYEDRFAFEQWEHAEHFHAPRTCEYCDFFCADENICGWTGRKIADESKESCGSYRNADPFCDC